MPPESVLPVSSSARPELEPEQRRLYRDVLTLLMRHDIPHAVSGVFALQQYTGIWRNTKDLDIFLTAQAAPDALELMCAHGIHCEVPDPIWLAKGHRDGYFVDFITGMSNAAISVTDSWIERSKPAQVLDVLTRILSPEELVASKLFVMRRERFDGADIAHLIFGTQGEMDWNRVLDIVGTHWEVLLGALILYRYIYPAQSHYVPMEIWNRLLERFQSKLQNPDPTARFRGSLVDENMFAIDVNEWRLDDLLSEYRACRSKEIRWPLAKRGAA